jgi:hypothetical protein
MDDDAKRDKGKAKQKDKESRNIAENNPVAEPAESLMDKIIDGEKMLDAGTQLAIAEAGGEHELLALTGGKSPSISSSSSSIHISSSNRRRRITLEFDESGEDPVEVVRNSLDRLKIVDDSIVEIRLDVQWFKTHEDRYASLEYSIMDIK